MFPLGHSVAYQIHVLSVMVLGVVSNDGYVILRSLLFPRSASVNGTAYKEVLDTEINPWIESRI